MVITQLTLLKDSSPLVHIKNTNQTTRTEGVKVQFLTPFKKRDHDSWGFVPRSKKIDKLCTVSPGSDPGRVSCTEFCRQMEAGNFRSLGVENSRGRVASKICKQTSKVRSADNKFVKYCTYVKYFRRGKKIIRKRCYRISTTRSGRPGFLQHLFHCSKKRRRSPPNIKLETSQCIHGKISFQDGNTKINHSSPPCGGLGVHLRSARCIPTNSHVSTSQEVSEVLCTGSSLPISSHALRHHSCTKDFYQTNGRSRWASPQSTNSHFYVSGRLASQKSDSRIVTSSIKSNNTTSGRSRIDNQFRQMPFSAFTDNYLSGCSFQPEQGVSSPLREQGFGNQPSNCRYNLQPPMSSFPFFMTVGTHGLMHRYSSIWPFTYAPYPNIPSLFLVPTYR